MTMSNGENWMADLDIFVDPDASETKQAASSEAIGKLLLEKRITIQDVVSAIGKYLTTADTSVRGRGIMLLGELLIKLALTPLEDVTIQTLSSFFTARLADWHCLRGALIGSIALLRRSPQVGAVEGSDVEKMAKSVLVNIHVQSLGQKDRLLCLEVFECLVDIHGVSVASLGNELVIGVCSAIEEEKDPKCLLVAFRLVENLVRLFPEGDGLLAEFAEDVFDIVSRYFPVSFTPPPNDTRGISRDDLVGALLRVFTSTPLFAPFCIPLLLEKLSSSLKRAQLDSLKYLGFCALSFGAQSICEHVGTIWLALKAVLIPPSVQSTAVSIAEDQKDDQIQAEALLCLSRCVEVFQKGVEETESFVTRDLLKLICEDESIEDLLKCVENDVGEYKRLSDGSSLDERVQPGSANILSMRAKEQARATGHMLAATVKASPSSCYIVTHVILSRLISAAGIFPVDLGEALSADKASTTDSHLLSEGTLSVIGLEVTVQILEAAGSISEKIANSSSSSGRVEIKMVSTKWLEPIRSIAPMLLMTFNHVMVGHVQMNDQSKLGVAGLQALLSFPPDVSPLSEEQLQVVLSILVEILLDKTSSLDLKDKALGAILAVSNLEERFRPRSGKQYVNILNLVTPKLLEAVEQAQTTVVLKSPLQALAALACPRQIARQTVLNGLGQILRTEVLQALGESGYVNTLSKLVMILDCISEDIIPLCETGSMDQKAASDIITDIWSAIHSRHHTNLQISGEVLSSIMAVNRVTVRRCNAPEQVQILLKAMSVLLDCDITTLMNEMSVKQEVEQDIPTIILTEEKGWLVALVASVVVGLLPTVVPPRHRLLRQIFVCTSFSNAGLLITSVAAQAISSLLNKWKSASSGTKSHEEKGDTLDNAIREAVDESLMPAINQYMMATSSGADGSACVTKKAVRGVYALAWIGKGLGMRGHSRVSDIAAVFLTLLQSEDITTAKIDSSADTSNLVILSQENQGLTVAGAAAESLGIILKDNSTCLDRDHNAIVRPLYKQRFFTSMLPALVEAVHKAGNVSNRIWFFRAFGHLLLGTPHPAVLTEGQKVFPLVLEGLSTLCIHSEDSNLLLSTLLALSSFLTDENSGRSIAAEYVPAMVNRLVTLVQYRSSMVIRETALQCLAAIVGLPFTRVFPVKPQVMKAVTVALDDHKRTVRKEAVRCCRVWTAISSK